MHIISLTVKNFRNYSYQSLRPESGTNIFLGKNAQGKTNLLEAVYVCSVGRSARTPRDKEMIKDGTETAQISLLVQKKSGKDKISIYIDRKTNKRIAINDTPITRVGELMGVLTAVYFSPDEISIVKGGPSDRRRFMDIALCQLSKAYFYALGKYNRILQQRNKLLKSGAATDDALFVWDEQLADCGSKIIRSRNGFLSRLAGRLSDNHGFLTGGAEKIALAYEGIEGTETAEIKENFLSLLRKDRKRDLVLGYTQSGAHKDDFKISIGEMDVRTYGSQGQQRSTAISLKLSELDILEEETSETPILLLDDVLSELDETRCINLFRRISGMQSVVTGTDIGGSILSAIESPVIFEINAGKVRHSK